MEKLTNSRGNLMPIAWLPNQAGFRFIAVMKDDSEKECVIIKDENGIHTFAEFQDAAAWKRINQ